MHGIVVEGAQPILKWICGLQIGSEVSRLMPTGIDKATVELYQVATGISVLSKYLLHTVYCSYYSSSGPSG